jgi:hypothetical protein
MVFFDGFWISLMFLEVLFRILDVEHVLRSMFCYDSRYLNIIKNLKNLAKDDINIQRWILKDYVILATRFSFF